MIVEEWLCLNCGRLFGDPAQIASIAEQDLCIACCRPRSHDSEDVSTVLSLRRQNHTVPAISRQTGVPVSTIQFWLHGAGMTNPSRPCPRIPLYVLKSAPCRFTNPGWVLPGGQVLEFAGILGEEPRHR